MIVKLTGSTTFLVALFLFEVSRNVAGEFCFYIL